MVERSAVDKFSIRFGHMTRNEICLADPERFPVQIRVAGFLFSKILRNFNV